MLSATVRGGDALSRTRGDNCGPVHADDSPKNVVSTAIASIAAMFDIQSSCFLRLALPAWTVGLAARARPLPFRLLPPPPPLASSNLSGDAQSSRPSHPQHEQQPKAESNASREKTATAMRWRE